MNQLASLLLTVTCLAGCASRAEAPRAAAPMRPALHGGKAEAPLELRHFYLLSPGPDAKLVVTHSSEVPLANR